MTKKSVIILLIVFMTAIFTLFSSLSFAETGNYNYAKSGDVAFSRLLAWEILQKAIDEDVSELEKQYLSDSDLSLLYSSSISIADVYVERENDLLRVEVSPYVYTANNGQRVEWIPYSVNDTLLNESNGVYTATVDLTDYTADTVEVKYLCSFSVKAEDLNAIINSTYEYSRSVSEKIDSENDRYKTEYAEYVDKKTLYDNYLNDYEKYLVDLAEYNAYLKKLEEWQKSDTAYKNYLTAKENYEKQLVNYRNYLTKLEKYNSDYQNYRKYLLDLDAYQQALNEYYAQNFTTEQQTALYHLEVMNYIVKPVTSWKRTLSGAILGNAVTQVLAEKESLITVAGVEARAVDLASKSTDELRSLITKYNSCKSDAERYAFYILSKDDLSKNFNDLLCSLDFIYQNPDYGLVRKIMAEKERTEQFEILLAQLYYICNALTETPIPNYITRFKGGNKPGAGYFDSSYTIGQSVIRTPAEVVGESGVLADNGNSAPLENGYPDMPAKPVQPKAVNEPTRPNEVAEPVAPTVVSEAGTKPEAVNRPTEPLRVEKHTEPTQYSPSEKELEYKKAYDSGVFSERTTFQEDVSVSVQKIVSKYFRNAKTVTVRFFDENEQPLYVIENMELGGYLHYEGVLPTKTRKGYICEFVGWQGSDGEIIDCNDFSTDKTDLNLYALFKETPQSYPVVWVIDGVEKTKSYPFDSTPVYDSATFGEPQKVRTGVRQYKFIGWTSDGVFYEKNQDLPIVCDEKRVYQAVFEESLVVNWVIDGIGTSMPVWKGETPDYGSTPTKKGNLYKYYVFEKWDNPIVPLSADATFTAVFRTVYYALSDNGALKIAISDDELYLDASYSSGDLTVEGLFEKAFSENKKVFIEFADCSLIFDATCVSSFVNAEIRSLSLEYKRLSEGVFGFECVFFDQNENPLNDDYSAVFTTDQIEIGVNSYLKSSLNGEEKEENYTFENSFVSFEMRSSRQYTLRPLYKVGIVKTEGIEYRTEKTLFEKGETVKIEVVSIDEGNYMKSVYAVTQSGVDLVVTDMTFAMPSSNVTVGLILDKVTYNISFIANGKVLFSQSYKHGDKVKAPTIPDYIGESGYVYKFSGWDKEVTDALSDAEYVAQFEKTAYIDNTKKPVARYTKLLKGLIIGVPVGVAVIIAVILAVVLVKRKKKKEKKDESKE